MIIPWKFSCKNCHSQFEGCHGICEKYISERNEYEKVKSEAEKRKKHDDVYFGFLRQQNDRVRKDVREGRYGRK